MSRRTEDRSTGDEADRKKNRYHFDRHTPGYRHEFEAITAEMQGT